MDDYIFTRGLSRGNKIQKNEPQDKPALPYAMSIRKVTREDSEGD